MSAQAEQLKTGLSTLFLLLLIPVGEMMRRPFLKITKKRLKTLKRLANMYQPRIFTRENSRNPKNVSGGLDGLGSTRVADLVHDLPGWLAEMAIRCTREAREDRFQSIDEIFADIKALSKGKRDTCPA